MPLIKKIGTVAAIAALAGCTSGNSRIEPPFQSVNPLNYSLQFAVGTANYQVEDTTLTPPAAVTITGLNTVETYRQPNGLSATLVNSPTINGPAGFVVQSNSGQAGNDAGTSSITSTSQSAPAGSAAAATPNTFGQSGGVFAYGFLPVNSTNQAENGNNGYTPYGQPFYTDGYSSDKSDISSVYLGGPPAYNQVRTGTYPSGFDGYTQGFNSFASTIAAGTYTLSDVVYTSTTNSGTLTKTASLGSTALLPTYNIPSAVNENGGDGSATFTVTVPAGVTETLLDVVDLGGGSCHPAYSAPFYYTVVDHTSGPATATITLPNGVGPIPPTGGAADPTLCAGDQYQVTEVGVDYPAYEAGVGQAGAGSPAESPTITGPNGQADITVSLPAMTTSGVYGMSASRQPTTLVPAKLHSLVKVDTFHPRRAVSHRR